MTGKQPLWNELFKGFENVIADVRQTVEEPWFDRAVTAHAPALESNPHAHGVMPHIPGKGQDDGFEW